MSAQLDSPPPAAIEPVTPRVRKDRTGAWFLAPAVVWIILFTIFPLLFALYNSFYSFRFGQRNQFVGLDNFGRLFTDPNLRNGLQVTLWFVLVTVTVEMLVGFGLALLLNREMQGKNILRAIMVLPLFATPVAMGYLGITIFFETNGPINDTIRALGGQGIPWLSSPKWAPVSMMILEVWQWTPFVFLVSLAGLQGLPQDVYEAAEVDGASGRQLFRSITMPLMAPTLWLILLLRMIEAFKVFDIPTSLTSGGPGRATEVYSLFTYRTALRFFDHGYAAAQGFLLLFIVMFIVTILYGRISELYE
ncbi:MAG: sugar ABC transporter permease [Caldilineaceae bacterium]|nr:sugar ABC transporter permease [Caldilineaceae bacterium]MCB9139126.1 sugar ABC transporter permease [Caldilineaceae bacterium]